MSIRLKKIGWRDSESFSIALIAGATYTCESLLVSAPDGEWRASVRWGKRHPSREAAKAACEQHALERIREAVEVVSDHIPDAKKMVNSDHLRDATKMIEPWWEVGE